MVLCILEDSTVLTIYYSFSHVKIDNHGPNNLDFPSLASKNWLVCSPTGFQSYLNSAFLSL